METLRLGTPISLEKRTLIPVERTVVESTQNKASVWVYARKEVLAVILCEGENIRVLSDEKQEISLASLETQIPNLQKQVLSKPLKVES